MQSDFIGGKNMNTVLSLIIMMSQNTLKTDINYTIATYILNHICEMEFKSIKHLSEECYTSTTSINRFCQALGFEGYSDFKGQLISNFKTRKIQLDDKQKRINQYELFEKMQLLSEEKMDYDSYIKYIDSIVEMIKEKKKIVFYGAVFPLALTQSFIEDMAVMGVIVVNKQISRGLNTFEKQDGVHIILTFSGRYLETKKNEYKELCHMNYPTVLISKEKEYIGDVTINIPMPETKSSDYDDIILLLLLDGIKLKYHDILNTHAKDEQSH